MKTMMPMWRAALSGIVLACTAVAMPAATQANVEPSSTATSVRGFLGITLTGQIHEAGASVGDVRDDFPAAQAGLRVGDVIVSFQGQDVDDGQRLYALMRSLKAGETVSVDYVRDGQKYTTRMTAVDREGREAPPPTPEPALVKAASDAGQEAPAAAARVEAAEAPPTPPAAVAATVAGVPERPANEAVAPESAAPTPNAAPAIDVAVTGPAAPATEAPAEKHAPAPEAVTTAAPNAEPATAADIVAPAAPAAPAAALPAALTPPVADTPVEKEAMPDVAAAASEVATPAAAISTVGKASQPATNFEKARAAFAKMDEQDFLEGIEAASQCASRDNYDCADRTLANIKELIANDEQQKLWSMVQASAQEGRRLLAAQRAAEEAQRRREIAQREAEERERREEERRQREMAWANGLQVFTQTLQSELQKGYEQQRQQQQFLDGLRAQAQAQQEAQRRQHEAQIAEQARQRAQQQQAAREALAAQLASGVAYRNEQIAKTSSAAERQRLQNDNAKAMQIAQQIGMAGQVSAQAGAATQASQQAAQARRQAEQQAEQQRLAEQRRIEQERQAAQRAEQQRLAAQQAEDERKRQREAAEAERRRQAEERRLAAEQAEREKKQAYQDWLAAKRRGIRLGAKSCDGKDEPYRLIGNSPSVPLPKSISYYSECITVKYEARCPGTPRGSGLLGSQYNFTGMGLGCLSAESKMSRRLPCKDNEVIVDVVDVTSCGG